MLAHLSAAIATGLERRFHVDSQKSSGVRRAPNCTSVKCRLWWPSNQLKEDFEKHENARFYNGNQSTASYIYGDTNEQP